MTPRWKSGRHGEWAAIILLIGLAAAAGSAAPEPRPTQPRQVLFIAGEASHGSGAHEFPAGSKLLADALNASGLPLRASVSVGWPASGPMIDAADVIVLYGDGLDAHVAQGRSPILRQRLDAGAGLVVIHFALEPPEDDPALRVLLMTAIGGAFEAGWSVNPTWTLEARPDRNHPVARGVGALKIEDEWYYHLRFREDARVQPVLSARPGADTLGPDGPRSGNPEVRAALARGQPQIVAWTHESRSGGRGFGFTGGHFHRNWYERGFRTLVLNGIVWTAGLEVPGQGVKGPEPSDPLYPTIEESIARGDAEDVKRHLRVAPARVHGTPQAKLKPLHQAILRRKADIVAILLEHGADAGAPDGMDRTPLHMAVVRGDLEIVESLLRQAVDPTRRDRQGWTPLHHAGAKDEVEIARRLLDHGTDPNVLSGLGGTALHEAAAAGATETARLLLTAGTDPSIRSQTGVTALDLAHEYERPEMVELLEAQPSRTGH